mmetsp:Transcript_16877/g.39628  ORF Transcript_16877/g.39628 Transcript_16877/m.39628 type:complete len:207 (+) Transcript_16877:473-1093(+)
MRSLLVQRLQIAEVAVSKMPSATCASAGALWAARFTIQEGFDFQNCHQGGLTAACASAPFTRSATMCAPPSATPLRPRQRAACELIALASSIARAASKNWSQETRLSRLPKSFWTTEPSTVARRFPSSGAREDEENIIRFSLASTSVLILCTDPFPPATFSSHARVSFTSADLTNSKWLSGQVTRLIAQQNALRFGSGASPVIFPV